LKQLHFIHSFLLYTYNYYGRFLTFPPLNPTSFPPTPPPQGVISKPVLVPLKLFRV
jgi:hypothetical protein